MAALELSKTRLAGIGRKLNAVKHILPADISVPGPLAGMPCIAKDMIATGTVEPSWGCAEPMATALPRASVIDRMVMAGACLIGTSVMTELAYEPSGFVHGGAVNPWHPDIIPGGSSSGSAILVASGCCFAALGDFTGRRPRGWLSPGLRETVDTADILKRNGIDYVCDWVVDDRPSWMTTTAGPLIAMPYNLEVNDSIIYAIERHATGEMAKRLEFTLRRFEQECRESAIILAIGLHPHLISVPHRIHELEHMLDILTASSDVGFFTGSELADWYTAVQPPPGR